MNQECLEQFQVMVEAIERALKESEDRIFARMESLLEPAVQKLDQMINEIKSSKNRM
jgi:hypothetical protein